MPAGQFYNRAAGQWDSRAVGQQGSGTAGQWDSRAVGQQGSGTAGQWNSRAVGQQGSGTAGQWNSRAVEQARGETGGQRDSGKKWASEAELIEKLVASFQSDNFGSRILLFPNFLNILDSFRIFSQNGLLQKQSEFRFASARISGNESYRCRNFVMKDMDSLLYGRRCIILCVLSVMKATEISLTCKWYSMPVMKAADTSLTLKKDQGRPP